MREYIKRLIKRIKIGYWNRNQPIDTIPGIKPLDIQKAFRPKHLENYYAKYRIKRKIRIWIATLSRRINRGKR